MWKKGKKCEGGSGGQVATIASLNKRKALLMTTTTITTKTMIIQSTSSQSLSTAIWCPLLFCHTTPLYFIDGKYGNVIANGSKYSSGFLAALSVHLCPSLSLCLSVCLVLAPALAPTLVLSPSHLINRSFQIMSLQDDVHAYFFLTSDSYISFCH